MTRARGAGGWPVDADEVLAALIAQRRALGLRQADIAEALGRGQQLVSVLERGGVELTVDTLARYARAVGWTLELTLRVDPPK